MERKEDKARVYNEVGNKKRHETSDGWDACARRMCCSGKDGTRSIMKRRFLFFITASFMALSALTFLSSTMYLTVSKTQWERARCKIASVTWRDDLYDVRLSNYTDPVFVDTGLNFYDYNGTLIRLDETESNDTGNGKETKEENPKRLQVKGWYYEVKVKYGNVFFHGAIKDPSEVEIIPPIYSPGETRDCLCVIERLRSEVTLQQDTYEKYLEYVKSEKTDARGGSGGGAINSSKMSDVFEELDEDADDVYFVIAVVWPSVNVFLSDHSFERPLQYAMVAISLVSLALSLFVLRISKRYYVPDRETKVEYIA
jgi:hypothetical protein